MSSRTKESASTFELVQECLAVSFVPKKTVGSFSVTTRPSVVNKSSEDATPDSPDDNTNGSSQEDCGFALFQDFIRENQQCYWNQCLVQTMSNLDFTGFIRPDTVLVSGSPYSLEVVRSAWARRVLRPPVNYDIHCLGDVGRIEMSLIPQTQFAPLPEALCKAVLELNMERRTATIDVIARCLETNFPKMIVPSNEILYRTLGTLIKERKVYHTGKGYFVVAPNTYRAKVEANGSPAFKTERQMLMTNEEAIGKLHSGDYSTLDSRRRGSSSGASESGRSRSIQTEADDILNASKWGTTDKILFPSSLKGGPDVTVRQDKPLERSHSLRLLRFKDKDKLNRSNSFKQATRLTPGASPLSSDSKSDSENPETVKREKRSVFSRLFRRSRDDKQNRNGKDQNGKRSTFAAQFPPVEWSDTDSIHLHSQGTQTPNADVYTPRVHLRSSSVGRVSSQDRHSFHMHSSTCSLRASERNHQHRCDSDPSLRLKSASLPRRSYPSVDLDSGSSPRHAPGTPSSKRSSRASSSPRRHPGERHHIRTSPAHREKLNNNSNGGGIAPPPQPVSNNKLSREMHFNIRNNQNSDGSWDHPTMRRDPQLETELKREPVPNHWNRNSRIVSDVIVPNVIPRTPTKKLTNQKFEEDFQGKTISRDDSEERDSLKEEKLNPSKLNGGSPTLNGPTRNAVLNDSLDLEVSLSAKTSRSPIKKLEPENESPGLKSNNHKIETNRTTTTTGNISIKTGGPRNTRPVSITTVTSITTSLSQGALKESAAVKPPPLLLGNVPKSRSSDSSPLFNTNKLINEKMCFSPVKSNLKLSSNTCDLLKDSGADDSGFLSVSPV